MTHSFTPPLLPLGTFVSQCIPALRASALLLLWLAHVPSGMQKSNRARGPWLRVQGSAQPIAEADRDEADKSMCPGSLWRELPIVPKAGQELPSYISTHTRSGCLRLAISVAGPRAALPPRPRALFFLFPPSHPSFCQARNLFYLHSPVASSLHVPCSSSGLRMSPVACKRATEPAAPGFMSRGPLSQLQKPTEMKRTKACVQGLCGESYPLFPKRGKSSHHI